MESVKVANNGKVLQLPIMESVEVSNNGNV